MDLCICNIAKMGIPFLSILSIWAPYLDALFGVSHEDIRDFISLRTTNADVHDFFYIPFRVSPYQLEVSFFIMIGVKRRSQFVCYPLKTQPRTLLPPHEQYYNNVLRWVQKKFTHVAGEHNALPPQMVRAKAMPKSRVQSPAVQSPAVRRTPAALLNLNIYGLGKLFSVTVEADDFVGDVMTKIEQTQVGAPYDRQQLYHHSRTGLVELFDLGRLDVVPARDGDYLTLFVRERTWEDLTAEEEVQQAKKKQQLEKVVRQSKDEAYREFCQRISDLEALLVEDTEKEQLKEFHKKYLDSMHKQRAASAECLASLKVFRDYDAMLALKYGRAWGPFGHGTNSSSSQ